MRALRDASHSGDDRRFFVSIHFPPDDEHNKKLLAEVHPSDWVNPAPKERYHLVVVGAGTAGLICAAGAAGLGAKVALVERHLMGGDCLNVGCVPSKGVISAARAWTAAREAKEKFGGPEATGDGNFAAAMERMRRLRAGISHVDGARRFAELGVDVFLGHGAFTGPDTVEVDGQQLKFRRAVIATGARASAPPIPGLADVPYLTNESVFSLTELPRRFTVIGAGPIGCELAQSFARFGSDVTILDIADRILPREDADAAEVVQRAMERDGVKYLGGAKITRAEKEGTGHVVHYEQGGASGSVAGDALLVAVGRAPNVEDLGLERADVQHDKQGVTVDDRLRTSNRKIYACGDICSQYKFTHAADAQARIVIANALFFGRGKASRLVMPWCTYTSPEIAHVGLYAEDAESAGHKVKTLTIPMEDVDRAKLDGEAEGFLRVHLREGSDQMLGATLVAAHAGDMIGELALAITHGIGLSKIATTIHPYPTQGEVIKKAADALNRERLTPTAKKVFEIFFRVFR